MGSIIVEGKTFPVRVRTRDWLDVGASFSTWPRRKSTKYIVEHYTAGANLARDVYRTLVQRHLSVHFVVDPDGVITQFCDADRLCAHAGRLDDSNLDGHQLSCNLESIGIEYVNPANDQRITRGVTREVLIEEIHGVEQRVSQLTSAQVASGLELTSTLCRAYGLPFAVPTEPLSGDVLTRVLTEDEFQAFRGVVAHYMLTHGKRDVNVGFMRAIAARPLRGRDGAAE
jgi:N-acetyl-anhydromuramyl-L-alanine amidase AmpD